MAGVTCARQLHRVDEVTGIPTWEVISHGVSLSLTQILPEQARAFYVNRGFALDDINAYAASCVYMAVMRNDSAPGVVRFRLADWSARVDGTERPPLDADHWLSQGPIQNAPAPALRLPDMDEEIIELAQLEQQVVVVNFWATWCPPCRREMPSLERLYQKTRDRGVTVLAVNIGEDEDTVFPFLGQLETAPNFPILFDREGASLDAWGVKGLPTTFVVGADGRLKFRAVGGREFDHPELVRQLLELSPSRER
jgi:thiol-disulfide isomerase/thioredoxin